MTDYAYLTTTGRRSGRPHTIEIWYAVHRDDILLIAGKGERSDWVRNLRRDGRVLIRLGGPRRLVVDGAAAATARVIDDPVLADTARRLVAAKYEGWREPAPLSEWLATGLPIAVRRPG